MSYDIPPYSGWQLLTAHFCALMSRSYSLNSKWPPAFELSSSSSLKAVITRTYSNRKLIAKCF